MICTSSDPTLLLAYVCVHLIFDSWLPLLVIMNVCLYDPVYILVH